MNMRYIMITCFMAVGSALFAANDYAATYNQEAVGDTVVSTHDYPMGYFEDEQGIKNLTDTTKKKNLAHSSNYTKASRTAANIKYIVIHYTGNDGDTDEANAACAFGEIYGEIVK